MRLRHGYAVVFSLAAYLASGAVGYGAEVRLKLKAGGFEVTGELVEFDGKNYRITSLALGTLVLEASKFDCEGDGCPGQTPQAPIAGPNIRIGGDPDIAERLLPELMKGYAASVGATLTTDVSGGEDASFVFTGSDGKPLGTWTVERSQTGEASAKFAEGGLKALISERAMSDDEVQRYTSVHGSAPEDIVLALDAFLFVVSQNNPALFISETHLKRVLLGEITNWSEVGLPTAEIKLYVPRAVSAEASAHPESLLGGPISDRATLLDTAAEVAEAVAGDPLALGITSFGAKGLAKPLVISSECSMIALPTPFSAKAEETDLVRRLHLYKSRTDQPFFDGFAQYVSTPEAQAIVARTGYIDQSVDEAGFDSQAFRLLQPFAGRGEDLNLAELRRFIADASFAKRLSITVRFEAGAPELDARGKQDVLRMAEILKGKDLEQMEVLIIGFADNRGSSEQNRQLASLRAMRVLQAITQASGGEINATALIAKSYGETAPIACNESEVGRARNRRVEIWVRDRAASSYVAAFIQSTTR